VSSPPLGSTALDGDVPATVQPAGAFRLSLASVIAAAPSFLKVAGTVTVCPGPAIWYTEPGYRAGTLTATSVSGGTLAARPRSGATVKSAALSAGTEAATTPADSLVLGVHRLRTE
jgi:hypothetical protein